MHKLTIRAIVASCGSIQVTEKTTHLPLQPANSRLIIWSVQCNIGWTEFLTVLAQHITPQQPLVNLAIRFKEHIATLATSTSKVGAKRTVMLLV